MKLDKASFLLMLCFMLATKSNGQLVNNGATIKIETGALVFAGGDVQNINSGIISNDGKLEVQGSFTNSATYNSVTLDDSLIMSGTGDVTLNGGGSTISYLTINKTANTNNVTLTGTTLLGTKLDYTSGNFTTDPVTNPSYVFSAPVAAVFNFAAGREITGNVKRTSWVNGAAVMFNQTNMLVTTNGGTTPADFMVTMIPQTAGGDPTQAEREVKRKFLFTQTGGTGFTSDIRFAYQDAELNTNTEANLVPWDLVTTEWNGRLTPVTRDVTANYVSTTGISFAELSNEWKLADPRYTFNATTFLRGPWNGTTAMNTNLNSGGIIPLSQPYNTTPFNYSGTESVAAIPNANVVDWVLVEFRKPSTGLPTDALSSTIIGRKAGFLLNNGTVVDLDGVTPIAYDITKQGAGFVVVRHRNHLGVMSNAVPSNAAGTFANDFSSLANSYKPSGAASNPVVLLAGVGGKYGMWAGDANKSGAVSASDISAIKLAIANSISGYTFTDTNLTGAVSASDLSLGKSTIASSGTGGTSLKQVVGNNNSKIITNIPDAVQAEH